MARWDYFQGDFSLGELSPLMAGRRDSPDYNRGLAIMQQSFRLNPYYPSWFHLPLLLRYYHQKSRVI